MLNITLEQKDEFFSDVYINNVYYPNVFSDSFSDDLNCRNISDFLFLSKFSFFDFIKNQIGSISHQLPRDENLICYFLFKIYTTYEDPGYLKHFEENKDYYEDDFVESSSYINKGNHIEAILNFKYGEWKKLYSIKEFQLFVHSQLLANEYLVKNARIFLFSNFQEDNIETLKVEFIQLDNQCYISEFLDKLIPILDDILDKSFGELDNEYSLDIYTTSFLFPEEYKVACKQYLIYFTQFLLDMGINVDTEIKDTVEGTLFSVIPNDKNEALQNIKELLVEYLNAPNFNYDNVSLSNNHDIALVQFQANLYHLKSQLAFANTQIEMKQAIIENKNATIQSLNLSNYQLAEKVQAQEINSEESIIEGVLSVKPIEKSGFKLNLPEILRRLKRKF